jgi:hypothetical protein
MGRKFMHGQMWKHFIRNIWKEDVIYGRIILKIMESKVEERDWIQLVQGRALVKMAMNF